jgi:signal transduction histidine kinase
MKLRRWALAALPALLGLGLSLWLNLGGVYNPIIFLRGDLGTLLFLLGLMLSLLLAAALAASARISRARRDARAEAAEDRRRFLRRLDHELKNPLTAILAGLANLAVASGEADRRRTLASVETQARRLSRLIADLRKLSDLDMRPMEHAPVDMTSLLEEVFGLVKDLPKAAGHQMTLTLPRAPWPLPTVPGDRDLLSLAIYNMLENSLKFTSPGNPIELRASEDGTNVLVEVADTGPGIPDTDLPHVWEELYRGAGSQGIPGSGLGLALVRGIVERHGGQVNVRSRAGAGTVFSMRLPTRDMPKLKHPVAVS